MNNYIDSKSLFQEPRIDQYGSHMVMSNVVKPSRFIYLNLDTTFCEEYANNFTNPSNPGTFQTAQYTIQLPERINDVKSISIINAEIPMTFYNISHALGNNALKLSVTISGTVYKLTVVIPDGEYTKTSLITELNTLFTLQNVGGYHLSCVLDGNYTEILYNIGLNSALPARTITVDFAVDDNGNFDKFLFKNKLGWILGFRNITYEVTSTSSIVSEAEVQVNRPKYLYISLDEFSKNASSSFRTALPQYQINKNILAKVTINKTVYGFGTILPANITNGYLLTDQRTYGGGGKTDLHKMVVQLLDECGNRIVLNGSDFSFCMQIELE